MISQRRLMAMLVMACWCAWTQTQGQCPITNDSEAFLITDQSEDSNNNVTLTFQTCTGYVYEVEGSSTLSNPTVYVWLATMTGNEVSTSWSDTNAPNYQQYFYRVQRFAPNGDSVGDGIPDWWREQYFNSDTTTNGQSCAFCDPMNDGYSNFQNYNLGGVPTSYESSLSNIPPYLLGWWQFEDGSGTLAADSSGNGQIGALEGSLLPIWTNGVIGGALSFFGGNGNDVVAPTPAFSQLTTQITVAGWVNAGVAGPLVVWNGTNNTCGFALRFIDSTDVVFQVYSTSAGQWVSSATATVASNWWTHIAGIYNGSTVQIYTDGVPVGSGAVLTDQVSVCRGNLAIAADLSTNSYFTGLMDDVRVYDQAVSSNAIAALFNIDTIGDGIPNWWRAEYFGSGSTTNSSSCASCDPTGDGFSNLQEFQAGLDPTNADSTPLTQSPGPAQTNLFFYDNLGRLAVLVGTNSTSAAFYSYDAVGNILTVSNQTIGSVNIFTISPLTAGGNTVITLQGTGFSTSMANNTVLFGSAAAQVVGATANQLQVVVPTNALSSLISVSTPFGVFTNSGTFTPAIGVSISPGSATLSGTFSQQFTAIVNGTTNQNVTWYINGAIPAGSSTVWGEVSSAGVYTAPLYPPPGGVITVHARSVANPSPLQDGVATVTVIDGLGAIYSLPVSAQAGLPTVVGPIYSPTVCSGIPIPNVLGPIYSATVSVTNHP
jgi:hypothetical protein